MKKPVKVGVVVFCLLLVLALVATLFIPVFSINLTPHASSGEYINVTGLDMIKGLFLDGSDFATQTEGVQKIFTFLSKGQVDYTEFIIPVYMNIMLWAYVVSLGLSVLMLIFTIFNFFGRRFSVLNVMSGLMLFLCGAVMCVCVLLQNGEYVSNAVIFYNIKVSFGAVMTLVIGFMYMMFAPKKRI